MNSFNTDAETKKIIYKYANNQVNIHTFEQSKFPRFFKDTMNPIAKPGASFNPKDWYALALVALLWISTSFLGGKRNLTESWSFLRLPT